MATGVLDVRVGTRLWFDGQVWTVCEVHPGAVRLQDGAATFRTATIGELLQSGSDLDDQHPGRQPEQGLSCLALASLSSRQRAVLEREAALLSSLLDSTEGEDGGGIAARLAATAAQLEVSVRTVQRRLRRFEQLGPAGLVDERLLKETRRSVDPRWDEACLNVLEEFTNQSTPSKQTVIRRSTKAFLAAVPDGVAPSRPAAYRRVDELGHGRYTFGEAKQRRSVAKRPHGVLGQLRATRPRGVPAPRWVQARRVRDGAGHDALGQHRAHGRDGPVRPLHQGDAATAGSGEVPTWPASCSRP